MLEQRVTRRVDARHVQLQRVDVLQHALVTNNTQTMQTSGSIKRLEWRAGNLDST